MSHVRPWTTTLLLIGAVLTGCQAGSDSAQSSDDTADAYRTGAPIDDPALALIVESGYGGDTLMAADFLATMATFTQRAPGMDESQRRELRRAIADDFVRRHVLRGEAARLGLEADSARVEEALEQIALQNGLPDRASFEEALAAQGMTLDSLRRLVEGDLPLRAVQEQMAGTAADPSSEEVLAFREERADQVRAQHILFRAPEPGGEAAVLEGARAVLDSAKSGVDFSELARRHSEGPSAPQGGDLGYFSRGDMVEPFSDAAFALADSGDVAPDLVETAFGYHIIRLLGRRTGPLMDSAQAVAQLTSERQREAFEEAYRQLSQTAVIRLNPTVVDAELTLGGGD